MLILFKMKTKSFLASSRYFVVFLLHLSLFLLFICLFSLASIVELLKVWEGWSLRSVIWSVRGNDPSGCTTTHTAFCHCCVFAALSALLSARGCCEIWLPGGFTSVHLIRAAQWNASSGGSWEVPTLFKQRMPEVAARRERVERQRIEVNIPED